MLPLFILAYAVFYTALCWQRFATFHAQIDMSYYLRLIWGIAHGHYDLPLVQARNILGLHLEPVVIPLALVERLLGGFVPLAFVLLFGQALAVSLLAWPVYRLGQRHLNLGGSGRIGGLLAAGLALLYPTVSVATLHDFHPVTLALAPLLATVDALDEKRLGRAFLFGALALLCREDIALQLLCLFFAHAIFGGPIAPLFNTARRRLGFAALLLGLGLYFFGYVLWIQPRYLPTSGSYGLHFGKMGENVRSGRDLLGALLRHPGDLLPLLIDGERWRYLLLLLWPMGFLPLLSPRVLAGGLPILGINLLSSFPRVLRLESHYTTALVPFVVGAGLIGAGRLCVLWRARQMHLLPGIGALLFFASVSAHIFHGGSPLAFFGERFSWNLFRDGKNAALLRQAVANVPADASVAARPGPLSHLALRQRVISPPEYDDGQPVDVILRGE